MYNVYYNGYNSVDLLIQHLDTVCTIVPINNKICLDLLCHISLLFCVECAVSSFILGSVLVFFFLSVWALWHSVNIRNFGDGRTKGALDLDKCV